MLSRSLILRTMLIFQGGSKMTNRTMATSPQTCARTAGLLYLVIIATAMFAEGFVRGRLIISGNAAATAGNIIGSPTLFRAGLVADLINCALDVAVAVVLYVLIRPVNRSLALLAALFRVTADTILGVVGLLHVAAIVILSDATCLKVFSVQQLEALAYLTLKLHGLGYTISIAFFGVGCGILGYLIHRSMYLPRLIGVLLVVAGLCYLFDSFGTIVAPSFSARLYPWPLLPGFVSELALCIWLMIKGVNVPKWNESVRG
jgi:Domain of unknown function (DUF4386)